MNAKAIAAFAAAITPLLALAAFWPSIEPAANWFLATIGRILERPVVHSVVTAITLGVLFAAFVPHVPWKRVQAWAPDRTKMVTRCVAVAIAGLVAFRLQHPKSADEYEAAIIFSTLAAGFTSALWTTLAGFLYRVKDKPESLK